MGAWAEVNLYAVIPSGNRLEELTNLVKVLHEDDVKVIIVNTGYDVEELNGRGLGSPENPTMIIQDFREPKNISRWWNLGLRCAEYQNFYLTHDEREEFTVAVLNDDLMVEPGFVQALANGIMHYDVAASFPDVYGMHRDQVFNHPSHWRMSGYAFALRGSLRLRADENMQWWYGDNDLEWQALRAGGVVTVGGLGIRHLYPNSTTVGELAEQAARDRQTFEAKWGSSPW